MFFSVCGLALSVTVGLVSCENNCRSSNIKIKTLNIENLAVVVKMQDSN